MKVLGRYLEGIPESPPTFLLPFLLPLSLLYRGGLILHRWFYSTGLGKVKRLPRPVVSVGNLVVGGGGKTPTVLWLVARLLEKGIRPAVLSRGYGRRSRETLIVRPDDSWRRGGDEPVLIARHTGVPVAVSAQRYLAGMKVLQEQDVDIFLLDDGFQHHSLHRDLDILVVDNLRRFGSGRLLPAGILREPLTRLRDADLVLVTKARASDSAFVGRLRRYGRCPVVWSDMRPTGLRPHGTQRSGEVGPPPEGPALAFCGIAYPQGFRESLERCRITVADLLVFPDHHPYSDEDAERIAADALHKGARFLVTTEKDAVRWPDAPLPIPLFHLTAETVMLEGGDFLMGMIGDLTGKGERSA